MKKSVLSASYTRNRQLQNYNNQKPQIEREAGHRGFQDMELRADGKCFLRVTMELVELELRYCMAAFPHVGH
ncbi:MAG: hypothetical protein K1W38_05625 [Lachnospiraceae bacterium]